MASKVTSSSIKEIQGDLFDAPDGAALIHYRGKGKKHWIICLFTSRNFGKRVSPPEVIIQNTELAVADMVRQIHELRADESGIGELWSCRFNSGLFGVKWELSRRVLEESGLDFTVVRPEDEDE
ncbi:hypothetical protein APSETT444_008578 [Aspergillus pseudonomiae]